MKHRCFLAVRIPPVEFDLTPFRELGKVKVVDPDLLHFTIHFFGNIGEKEIELIEESLSSLSFSQFSFTIDRTGIIPKNHPSKLRVLYVTGTEGEKELMQLAEQVIDRLKKKGFTVTRSFLPHVTVARVKRDSPNRREISRRWMEEKINPVVFQVKEVTLVESILTPNGPIYTDIISFPLLTE